MGRLPPGRARLTLAWVLLLVGVLGCAWCGLGDPRDPYAWFWGVAFLVMMLIFMGKAAGRR